jgi:hypothetical protein
MTTAVNSHTIRRSDDPSLWPIGMLDTRQVLDQTHEDGLKDVGRRVFVEVRAQNDRVHQPLIALDQRTPGRLFAT